MIDSIHNIDKCSWPTSSIFTYPTILNIPSSITTTGQIFIKWRIFFKSVFRLPKTPMNCNNNGTQLGQLWHTQYTELGRMISIWYMMRFSQYKNPFHKIYQRPFCKLNCIEIANVPHLFSCSGVYISRRFLRSFLQLSSHHKQNLGTEYPHTVL